MKTMHLSICPLFIMLFAFVAGVTVWAESSQPEAAMVSSVKSDGVVGTDIIISIGKEQGLNVNSRLKIYNKDEDGFVVDIATARVTQVLDNKAKATIDKLLIGRTVQQGDLVSSASGNGFGQRVMVIVPEQHLARRVPDPAAETEIIRSLVKNGYQVVDDKISKEIMDNEKMIAKINGDAEEFVRLICDRTSADIIIFGEAFSQGVQPMNINGNSAFKCGARVEIRAVRKDTAQIIYSDAAQSNALDSAEELAGKRALMQTARLLMTGKNKTNGFVKSMEERLSSGKQNVQCEIKGINDENTLKSIQDALEDAIGSDAYRNAYVSGTAKFTLGGAKSPEEYSSDISKVKIKGGKLNMVSSTANKLTYDFQ